MHGRAQSAPADRADHAAVAVNQIVRDWLTAEALMLELTDGQARQIAVAAVALDAANRALWVCEARRQTRQAQELRRRVEAAQQRLDDAIAAAADGSAELP